MHRLPRGSFFGLAALSAVSGVVRAQTPPPIPTLTDLGVLTGGAITTVIDVSGDGKVAVGQCFTQPGGWRAFRWKDGVIQNLGTLSGGNFSTAVGANHDGQIVIGGSNSTTFAGLAAFFWQFPGPMTSPVINVLTYWEARGISGNGLVGVGNSGNTQRAVRWTAATGKVELGTLPGHVSSAAYATNGDGSVVVGGSAPQFPNQAGRAFLWTSAGGMQDLGVPAGSISSVALGVSSDGFAVVGMGIPGPGSSRAFLWTPGEGMKDLGSFGGSSSVANGVSALGGRVVGSSSTPGGSARAFLWTEHLGMVDLNTYLAALGTDLTGWVLERAMAISDDGVTIVGDGKLNGFSRSWIVRLDMDTDGDGLLDNWETDGVPYLDSAFALRRLVLPGADPMHKDLYVEVDAMEGQGFHPTSVTMVVQAFADAPLTNPNGVSGITLHVLENEHNLPHVPSWVTLPQTCWPVDFYKVREAYFGTPFERKSADAEALLKAKAKAYRYCILADQASSGWGGCGETGGDNFVIYQGSVSAAERDAAKFMHELGHNLGLRHGGGDGFNGKPNYPSIMNYVFAYPYAWCEDFWKLDYSRADLGTIHEAFLDENAGIGTASGPYTNWFMPYGVNINNGTQVVRQIEFVMLHGDPTDFGDVAGTGFQDGLFTTNVEQDLNYCVEQTLGVSLPSAPSPGDELDGHDDWASIRLPLGALHSPQGIPEYPSDELTEAAIDWINQNFPKAPSAGCYPDCNKDGTLTIADFGCFQGQFVSQAPYADCNKDGAHTIADFGCFQSRFVAGCP